MTALKTALLAALPFLFGAGAVAANGSAPSAVAQADADQRELSIESSIGDVLHHPSFSGFARLVLPWDDRKYDEQLELRDIEGLLPYHTHVDPRSVVSGLNRMLTEIAAGRQVFYDIYSKAEKAQDPGKKNTGLFFFRGKPGAPFAIVAPGGGFAYVGSVHEGFPYAMEINRQSYNVFVLKYRVGQGGAIATQDLATALSFVFRNHSSLAVSTDGYSLWGSSAGARMAASVGSHGAAAFGGDPLPKPSTVVMAYTSHSHVASSEPPTFVVVGSEDGIAPPSSMERRVDALRKLGTPVEFREFPSLGHGFGIGAGTSAAGWIADGVRFWEASR